MLASGFCKMANASCTFGSVKWRPWTCHVHQIGRKYQKRAMCLRCFNLRRNFTSCPRREIWPFDCKLGLFGFFLRYVKKKNVYPHYYPTFCTHIVAFNIGSLFNKHQLYFCSISYLSFFFKYHNKYPGLVTQEISHYESLTSLKVRQNHILFWRTFFAFSLCFPRYKCQK